MSRATAVCPALRPAILFRVVIPLRQAECRLRSRLRRQAVEIRLLAHDVQVLARDVSERKRAEHARIESAERLRATFDEAGVGMAELAPDGRLLRVNSRFAELLGAPARWYRSDVLQTPHELDGTADLVYTGRGALCWLQNMEAYHYIRQVRDSGMIAPAVVEESSRYLEYFFRTIQKGLQEGRIKPYPIDLIGGILYQDILAVMNLK